MFGGETLRTGHDAIYVRNVGKAEGFDEPPSSEIGIETEGFTSLWKS